MVEFLIGADPEVFVRKVADNSFVTAHGMIPGDKKSPFKVDKGAVQVDGMALEFNIDPSRTAAEFINNINVVKHQLQAMIGKEYALENIPSIYFSEDVWKTTPKEAKELGCDPDFNAWMRGAANPRPGRGENDTLRTGAGHIHIGWGQDMDIRDPNHTAACISLVKQLDLSLGLASLSWDTDSDRRKLYGRAGAYRPKPYGVEYRVLSNAWLKSDELMGLVFNIATHACNDLVNGYIYTSLIRGQAAVGYINNSNVRLGVHSYNVLRDYTKLPKLAA